MESVYETNIDGYTCKRGKVRDVYDLGENLLIVATDRISAFDWVIPNSVIPGKGQILTAMSLYWFKSLVYSNHLISAELKDFPEPFQLPILEGRSMLVRKCKLYPVECIVRGYLTGSAWEEYKKSGMVSGCRLPPKLKLNQQFPEPLFTPSTKAEHGAHDENITFAQMSEMVSPFVAESLRRMCVRIYKDAACRAWDRGVIIADTKFEIGVPGNVTYPIFVDEVLTPDSSRFWRLEDYKLGERVEAIDKQYVRDYLLSIWRKDSGTPPPPLSEDVVCNTLGKYLEVYKLLTGEEFSPKN